MAWILGFLAPLFSAAGLVSLVTLTVLEIVLGIDNIVVLTLIVLTLPVDQQERARRMGLNLALIMRIGMLMGANWLVHLADPILILLGHGFSLRDLILISGGFYLVYQAVNEIYKMVEEKEEGVVSKPVSFKKGVAKIVGMDMLFALDSVITAVGMVKSLCVMIVAVFVAIAVMKRYSGQVGGFISRNHSVKMLALAFLFSVGTFLIADGMGRHIEKMFLYLPMGFAAAVEGLNMRLRHNRARRGAATRATNAEEEHRHLVN